MKVSLTEQVSRCSTEGHHWSHHPCSDPHSSFQPCTIYIPLWHMLRWHHCSSLNPIVHCLSSAVFPMGPWPVRGKGHCKYCAKILPAPSPPIELLKMEQTSGGWALPSCSGHFSCKTSNGCESFYVKDRYSEIIRWVLTLQEPERLQNFLESQIHDCLDIYTFRKCFAVAFSVFLTTPHLCNRFLDLKSLKKLYSKELVCLETTDPRVINP